MRHNNRSSFRRRGERDQPNGHPSRSDNAHWRSGVGSQTSNPVLPTSKASADVVPTVNGKGNESLGSFKSQPAKNRFILLFSSLIGLNVEVQNVNGNVFSGILHTISIENLNVVLKMAKLIRSSLNCSNNPDASRTPPIVSLIIQSEDVLQIIAKDVIVGGEFPSSSTVREHGIEIDSSIAARSRLGQARELKPWIPEPGEEDLSADLDLRNNRPSNGHGGAAWDQFEANKALFGVESTYDENLYTLKLENPSEESVIEAEKIARAIESKYSHNIHVAEERGHVLPAEVQDMDEEERYSSVTRQVPDGLQHGPQEAEKGVDACNKDGFASPAPAAPAGLPKQSTQSVQGSHDVGQAAVGGGEGSSAPSTPTPPRERFAVSSRVLSGGIETRGSIGKEERSALEEAAAFHKGHLRVKLSKGPLARASGSSPYHSPVSRHSPMLSPLLSDANLHALNLDPSRPQVGEDVIEQFVEFKRSKNQVQVQESNLGSARKAAEPKTPASSSTPRRSAGKSDHSHGHGLELSSLSRTTSGTAASKSESTPGVSSERLRGTNTPPLPPAAALAAAAAAAMVPSPVASTPALTPSASPTPPPGSMAADSKAVPTKEDSPPSPVAAAVTGSHASSSSPPPPAAATTAKKSTLNAKAKEFVFNPKAAAFQPSSMSQPGADHLAAGRHPGPQPPHGIIAAPVGGPHPPYPPPYIHNAQFPAQFGGPHGHMPIPFVQHPGPPGMPAGQSLPGIYGPAGGIPLPGVPGGHHHQGGMKAPGQQHNVWVNNQHGAMGRPGYPQPQPQGQGPPLHQPGGPFFYPNPHLYPQHGMMYAPHPGQGQAVAPHGHMMYFQPPNVMQGHQGMAPHPPPAQQQQQQLQGQAQQQQQQEEEEQQPLSGAASSGASKGSGVSPASSTAVEGSD